MFEFLKVLFYLFIFVIILWGSYFLSRKMSVYSLRFGRSKYMMIVDKLIINKDTGLAIIKIADKHLLVSLAASKLEIIRELNSDELIEIEPDNTWQMEPYVSVKNLVGTISEKVVSFFKKISTRFRQKKQNNNSFFNILSSKLAVSREKTAAKKSSDGVVIDKLLDQTSNRTKAIKDKLGIGVVKNKN